MGRAASHSGSSGPGDRADPAGPDASGRMLAQRYRLTGGPLGSGVAATDTRSGAAVQLDAVPLPELVTPFDQDRDGSPVADETAVRALDRASFAAAAVPDHPRLAQAFEVFAEDGYLWVVGEAVRGVPLGVLLDRSGACRWASCSTGSARSAPTAPPSWRATWCARCARCTRWGWCTAM